MQLQEQKILIRIDELLRNSLKYLKDEEFQKKVWFGHHDQLVGSYLDTCVHFLEHSEYIFKFECSEAFLGRDNFLTLKKLYKLVFDHFRSKDECIDPDELKQDELLNDPKWQDIQTLAGEVELRLKDFVKRKEHEAKDR